MQIAENVIIYHATGLLSFRINEEITVAYKEKHLFPGVFLKRENIQRIEIHQLEYENSIDRFIQIIVNNKVVREFWNPVADITYFPEREDKK